MSSAPFVQQHLRLADSGRSFSPGSFAPLLKKLVLTPSTFSLPDVSLAMEHLATEGGAGEAQIGAFLTALRLSGQDVDAAVVAACATVMRHHSLPLAPPALSDAEAGPICDIVGTGGDGQNTFNVSTTAGIVAAGAGCRVYKHGNKAATSSSGSADILISLECPVMSIPSSAFETITKSSSFLFLYAPNYHPAMKILAPIRKSLPFPTVFNILGPLINPARPSAMIVGVHSPGLGRIFIQAMKVLGVKRAWVVCGREGLDEISPDGETDVWDLKDGVITEKVISPSDFGLPSNALSTVVGGTPAENASTLIALLDNQLETTNPIENFVVINTAALLLVAGKVDDLIEGVCMARESIRGGGAKTALARFREASQKSVLK